MDKLKSLLLDKKTQESFALLNEVTNNVELSTNIILDCKKIIPTEIVNLTSEQKAFLGPDVMSDVEMFKSYTEGSSDSVQSSTHSTVHNALNNTKTSGGSLILQQLLSKPTHDSVAIQDRINLVEHTTQAFNTNSANVCELLERLKDNENGFLWIYSCDAHPELAQLYELVYFHFIGLNTLNNSAAFLTGYNLYKIIVSPLVGIISPIAYFLIPYLILVLKFKLKVSFLDYIKSIIQMLTISDQLFMGNRFLGKVKYVSYVLSLLFYFQGLFNSVEVAKLVYNTSKVIYTNIKSFVEFVQDSDKLAHLFWTPLFTNVFKDCTEQSYTNSVDTFKDIERLEEFAVYRNFGRALKIFKQLDKTKYIPLYTQTAMIDCMISVVLCVKNKAFSVPNLVKHKNTPLYQVEGLWHPCLGMDKAVPNDLLMKPQNIIITGPNAGGKSTFLRSVLINILLVQSLGISCSKQTSITPYSFINSQINIPDCKGSASLFEAEMYRCKYNIDQVNKLSSDKFAFLAMDEIFNSTNPVEGIAGAFAVVKYLASLSNVCSIVTTHYLYLTKLKQEAPDCFATYKMNVIQNDSNNKIDFPYKLTAGVSRQYIALELLRQNGFNSDILDVAQETKRRLLLPKKSSASLN